MWVFQVLHCLITPGGVVILLMRVLFRSMTELGWGKSPWLPCRRAFQVACLLINLVQLA